MVKTLARAGVSLADVYDVEGSIAGTDQLLAGEVSLIHEMGNTIFSERFRTTILRDVTGAIAQNIDFDRVISTDIPIVPARILGIRVLANAQRIAHVTVGVRDSTADREMPIFTWNPAVDSEIQIRWSDDGAAVGTVFDLRPLNSIAVPSFFGGEISGLQMVRNMVFRGRSTGFGAGTVQATLLVFLAFPETAGVSSRGLPIPSW